jgi:hypothetical protein
MTPRSVTNYRDSSPPSNRKRPRTRLRRLFLSRIVAAKLSRFDAASNPVAPAVRAVRSCSGLWRIDATAIGSADEPLLELPTDFRKWRSMSPHRDGPIRAGDPTTASRTGLLYLDDYRAYIAR